VDPAMAGFLGDANLVPATVDGDRVMTPFGSLALRSGPGRPVNGRPSVALVRPEQLSLSSVMSGVGLRATVLRTQFHGHDMVITVRPEGSPDPITVRAEGDVVVAPGTEVEITADGSAMAWPTGVS
jgi:iron(III) transport system ATP-binding protein